MGRKWEVGDLLEVLTTHSIEKGSMENEWPDVYSDLPLLRPTVIDEGTVVVALDSLRSSQRPGVHRPRTRAYIRALHKDGVWVLRSKHVKRVESEPT
jgi:hypothetical protein